MSSAVRNKMYDYEITPPPGTWEKITVALDESELSRQYPARLRSMEATPPAQLWAAIAASLDTMADHAGKLARMEVTPPPAAWDKIAASLDAAPSTLSNRRKISPFYRYAAAAVVTGLLAWAGLQFFSNSPAIERTDTKNAPATALNNNLPVNPLTLLDDDLAIPDIAASLEEARNDAALEASKKTYARLDLAEKRTKIKNVNSFFFVTDEYEPAGTRGLTAIPEEPVHPHMAERYIMLFTPDGNIIRMSKKLGELVCCVSGEEQDKDCVDQLKKWRSKLANPSTAHSSGNIMDFLSLMHSIQDN